MSVVDSIELQLIAQCGQRTTLQPSRDRTFCVLQIAENVCKMLISTVTSKCGEFCRLERYPQRFNTFSSYLRTWYGLLFLLILQ